MSIQKDTKDLAKLLCDVRGEAEMRAFLEDILSPSEIESLIERWRIVSQILAGKTQRQIKEDLGVSFSKLSRASRVVQFGEGTLEKLWKRRKER